MSFGYSVGDFLLLTQLAYRTVQNARKACGAHDDLAREVSSLHTVLQRVEGEVLKPESILNKTEDNRRRELARLARHCERVLKVLEQILDKYNALPNEKRSAMKLWQRVKFGNGEMLDLGKIRSELATHTQALNMFLNLLSIGSQGKVEKYMDSHGEDLREIKDSLHWVTASMQASSHEEKSILTTYAEDDKAIWKTFRRELIKEGFSSRLLDEHKRAIKEYVIELGERGALDEPISHDNCTEHSTALFSEGVSHSITAQCPEDSPATVEHYSGAEASSLEGNGKATSSNHISASIEPASSSSTKHSGAYTDSYLGSDEGEDDEPNKAGHVTNVPAQQPGTTQLSSSQVCADDSSSEEEEASSETSFEFSSPNTDRSSVHLKTSHVEEITPRPRGIEINADESFEEPSPHIPLRLRHSTYRQPFILDIEDEDFLDGAHPNCVADVIDDEDRPHFRTSSFESQQYGSRRSSISGENDASNVGNDFEEHDRERIQATAEEHENNESGHRSHPLLPLEYRDMFSHSVPLTRESLRLQQHLLSDSGILGTEASVHDEAIEFFQQRCSRQSRYEHNSDDFQVTPNHWGFLSGDEIAADIVAQYDGIPGKELPDNWQQVRITPKFFVPDTLPSVRGSAVIDDMIGEAEAWRLISSMDSDCKEGFFWRKPTTSNLLRLSIGLDLSMYYLSCLMKLCYMRLILFQSGLRRAENSW